MKDLSPKQNPQPKASGKRKGFDVYHLLVALMVVAVIGTVLFLVLYHPAVTAPVKPTLDQKMAHLQYGTPLPGQNTTQAIPRWLLALVLGFAILQIYPLVLASNKARKKNLEQRDIRQIEFLTETPMFLGLLGSLLGVCMMQFISGSLAAPLAYLTSITGILLYLFGRFTILGNLPFVFDPGQE